jgi:hypothetical protein
MTSRQARDIITQLEVCRFNQDELSRNGEGGEREAGYRQGYSDSTASAIEIVRDVMAPMDLRLKDALTSDHSETTPFEQVDAGQVATITSLDRVAESICASVVAHIQEDQGGTHPALTWASRTATDYGVVFGDGEGEQ